MRAPIEFWLLNPGPQAAANDNGTPYRWPEVYCSQCGKAFGPGDKGYSHCVDHRGRAGS